MLLPNLLSMTVSFATYVPGDVYLCPTKNGA